MAYQPSVDEKLVPIMLYTPQKLIWGKLLTKKAIRVSSWLQNEMSPEYFLLSEAQALLFGAGQATYSIKFPTIQVATAEVLAYHLLPPADESPYFDVNEPNRRLAPVTIIAGIFRFDCGIRIATQSELQTFLSVQKGNFMPIFEITMSCPLLPNIKSIQVPFMLLRQSTALFAEENS